jgi:glutamyl-tRNA reductase
MEALLAGLNHTTAPVEVREKLAFSDDEAAVLLPALRERLDAKEILLLSTCNRTEILAIFTSGGRMSAPDAVEALCRLKNGAEPPRSEVLYEFRDEEAIRHVFRVAAGLDSMILGEPQVLGQVRQAYSLSTRGGVSGLYLNRIMHAAFHVGKRVRTETELGFGALSVGSVAAMLAGKVFGNLKAHAALVVGAGEMAQAAALQLKEQGIQRLVFANRTYEKAVELAARCEGEVAPFEDLYRAMERADIVISSTGAPGIILTHEMFHQVMAKRHTRPIFLVDIAVPRDMDPEINNHENAFLYDIDNLQEVVDHNLARRKQAIPAAETLISEELEGFRRWKANLVVKPVVKLLQERFEEVRRCEVTKAAKGRPESSAEDLEKLTRLIQNKLLHQPMDALKSYDPDTEEGQRALAIICKLFDLK